MGLLGKMIIMKSGFMKFGTILDNPTFSDNVGM